MNKPILIVDGHNDLPWHLRETADSAVTGLSGPGAAAISPFTTMDQLPRGGLAAQFWSVWVPSSVVGPDAVKTTLEQIDLVDRLIRRYPERLGRARTAAEAREVMSAGRTASLLSVEGGQQIDESLGVLRIYARLGVRSMTLTWSTTHSWADSATDEPRHRGLSAYGREVVQEMVRIGMIPDLSHVSPEVMHQTLDIVDMPVMFSHSSAHAVNPHPRNVPDDVLDRVPGNGGIVMVTFVPSFISAERRTWANAGEHGTPPEVTVAQVADHCDHLRERLGVAHIGLGGDYCGTATMPRGLESVAEYPVLLAELASRGWSRRDLEMLGSENALRVLADHDPAHLAAVQP